MKQLLLAAVTLILFSCSKEQILEKPSGTWTIVETNTDEGGTFQIQKYTPSSEITIEFGADGNLVLTGANPGTAMSPLWLYDKYTVSEGNMIRFYQSNGNKHMEAYFTVNGELFLNYLNMRCGYEERFLKIR